MKEKATVCACFFDLENIPSNPEIIQQVISKLQQQDMNPGIRLAVTGATRNEKEKKNLETHGIRLVKTKGRGKNTADFRIVIEIMRLLHENPQIGTIAIVSNDQGFAEILHEIKSRKKRGVIITINGKNPDNPAAKLANVHLPIKLEGKPQPSKEQTQAKKDQSANQAKTQAWKILPSLEDLLTTTEHLPENKLKSHIASLLDHKLKKQAIDNAEKQAILTRLKQNGIQYRSSSAIMKKLRGVA
jgi:hypothetical protein